VVEKPAAPVVEKPAAPVVEKPVVEKESTIKKKSLKKAPKKSFRKE
tara:strand:- start:376 stop:513 length:138 start_codon:yes stop_codon:yes gene_type:complete